MIFTHLTPNPGAHSYAVNTCLAILSAAIAPSNLSRLSPARDRVNRMTIRLFVRHAHCRQEAEVRLVLHAGRARAAINDESIIPNAV